MAIPGSSLFFRTLSSVGPVDLFQYSELRLEAYLLGLLVSSQINLGAALVMPTMQLGVRLSRS